MLSFLKKLFIGLLSVLMLSVSVGATAATAVTYVTGTRAVGLNFKGGPGHLATVSASTWNNGKRGFCIDFGKAMPNRAGTTVLSATALVPGMNAEESKKAKFIANKYAATTSPEIAANASLAIWVLQHDAAFNTWYSWARSHGVITAARYNAVNAMLADAAQHAPYKMSVSTSQVLPGQIGSGAVPVLGSNGKPAVGRTVTLIATNARIVTVNGVAGTKGTTRSNGVVFTHQRTNTGVANFKAVLTSPSSATAGISISSAGRQRTLSGGYTESAVAYYSYNKLAGQPSITTVCASDCNGVATATFKFANPSGTQAIKWIVKAGTVAVATLSAKPGTTGTAVARIADGKFITSSSYCYTGTVLGGACTTGTVVVATPYEVVCPAWAVATFTVSCNCTAKTSSATITAPAGSPRFYRGFVSINGVVTQTQDLVNGQVTIIKSGTLSAGSTVIVSFTAFRDAARTAPLLTNNLVNITVN